MTVSIRQRLCALGAKALAGLASAATLIAMFAAAPTSAQAADVPDPDTFISVGASETGSTYYVDGARGDDANDGLSAGKPWKSLTKVSSITFRPGDHILLESSSTWNGQMLDLKGSGTAGNAIVVDLYTRNDDGTPSYSADSRPVINGNGTYGTGSFKRYVSGAVQLVNQEYWTIRNLEVTNTPDLANAEGYKKHGDAQRAGILLMGYGQNRILQSITVENNYVHDVQTEYYLKAQKEGKKNTLKAVGGIIALGHWLDPDGNQVGRKSGGVTYTDTGFNDLKLSGNIVIRAGLEGIRTKADISNSSYTYPKLFSNVTIANNYLQDIAGDAIVVSEIKEKGLVEGNTVVRACAADYGTHNYAALWAMASNDVTLQYNEVYGTLYGYNDGEAFDIDMQSDRVTYQYNYSHNNPGGFLLLMSNQTNSVVRYNISANDGGGQYAGTDADQGGGNKYSYKEQSIFHYWVKSEGASMPQIYNNTFYVGDGISTSLFGEGNSSDNSGTIAHFTGNIIRKVGSGSVKFLANQPANGSDAVERKMNDNPERFIKNNVLPASMATEKSGATVDKLTSSGNVFEDPKLAIDSAADGAAQLAAQIGTTLANPASSLPWSDPAARMRERAKLFRIADDSPAVGLGTRSENLPATDFFGNSLADRAIDAGAHQASNHAVSTEYVPETVTANTPAGVYPVLPESIAVTVRETANGNSAERIETHAVRWDYVEFDRYQKAGTLTVTGTIDGIAAVKAQATVTVTGELGEGKAKASYLAEDDATVQKGTPNQTMGTQVGASNAKSGSVQHPFGREYTNNYVLKLKNAESANYNRRFYVKFDPSAYASSPATVKDAKIRLTVSRYDKWNGSAGSTDLEQLRNTSFVADVYATDADWDSSTLTWNNGPLNAEVTAKNHDGGTDATVPDYAELKPVAHQTFVNGQIVDNGNVAEIDVTDYLRSLKSFDGPVSFLVDIPMSRVANFNRDNSGFDAFSLEGAAKAFEDYEAGNLTVPSGFVMDESTFAPHLTVSDVYITSTGKTAVTIKPGTVPALPETVTVTYSDGTATDVKVTWEELSADDFAADGTYTVLGHADGIDMPIPATVTVESDRIVSFDELPALDRPVGLPRNDLGMPGTVKATLSNGSHVELTVMGWDDDASNYSEQSAPGTYRFPGAVELPAGVSNPDGLRPLQTVTTHPKPASVTVSIGNGSGKMVAGTSTLAKATVIGAEPYTTVDEWGSAVVWSITSSGTVQNPATIDAEGTIVTTANTTPGTYTVAATSDRVPGVSGTATVTVAASGDTTELKKLIAEAKALKPADGKHFTEASLTTLNTAIAAAEALIGNEPVAADDVDAAVQALRDAIDGMESEDDVTPEPEPEPTPKPDPSPEPEPEPGPDPTPKPEPSPEPKPEPNPDPTPEPEPEPSPEPTPEPDAKPSPNPEPAPETPDTPDDDTASKPKPQTPQTGNGDATNDAPGKLASTGVGVAMVLLAGAAAAGIGMVLMMRKEA